MTGGASDPVDAHGLILHASCVVLGAAGVLILGPSGAGKSSLALQLMAHGAALVADDRTEVTVRDGGLWATCPPQIAGRIEARGVGLLSARPAGPARLALAVDLGRMETERLPEPRQIALCGDTLPLLWRAEGPAFPAAILQYVRSLELTEDPPAP